MTVRDRDRGARSLLQRVLNIRPTVRVGVMGDEAAEPKRVKNHVTGVIYTVADTVADIASIHEFGLGVPRRSFIADWADESEADARRRLSKAAQRISERGGLERELELFGLWAQGEIQQRISRRIMPPLFYETVERKGSDVPLIDTGQLRSSITFVVTGA